MVQALQKKKSSFYFMFCLHFIYFCVQNIQKKKNFKFQISEFRILKFKIRKFTKKKKRERKKKKTGIDQ